MILVIIVIIIIVIIAMIVIIILIMIIIITQVLLKPLTIKYCQGHLRIFRVSLVAAMRDADVQTRRHRNVGMEKPSTTSQEARTKSKSECEFRSGCGTSFRHPNANPKTTTGMYSHSRAHI